MSETVRQPTLAVLCFTAVVLTGMLIAPAVMATGTDTTEEPYLESVPEEDDPGFEAAASDGSWVSYHNTRDEYRMPYLGDGSGKICVTLVNEDGETIAGETVPDTSVTIPTGESLEWHTSADPMVVEFPVTDHYSQPLDADQFGTDPDLPQGDGYLDSHCIELHGLPENATIEYGEAELEGESAADIEVVGYIQQAHEAWDSDVDPLEDAESYEEAGGGWTYETEASHGQVVVVLQLVESEDAGAADGAGTPDNAFENESEDEADAAVEAQTEGEGEDEDEDEGNHTAADSDSDDSIPGFGIQAAIAAIVLLGIGAVALRVNNPDLKGRGIRLDRR